MRSTTIQNQIDQLEIRYQSYREKATGIRNRITFLKEQLKEARKKEKARGKPAGNSVSSFFNPRT